MGNIPSQAILNKLCITDLPRDFRDIRRLGQVLISKQLLFKKVAIMPKSQPTKLKGALVNIPIETLNASSLLPRQECRGYVYFEPIRPRFMVHMLEYLKHNNKLYRDITLEPNNILENLLGA